MTSAPVAHHHAVKRPFALQYAVERVLVVAVVLVIVKVVCTHNGPNLALLHGSLERRQIDLMQSAVAYYDVHLITIFLVIVQTVMLHACRNAIRLQTLYVRHHHRSRQVRVFAHILEVASAERGAIDVDARSENHVLATIEGFFAKTLAVERGEVWVPCGSETGQRRERHA